MESVPDLQIYLSNDKQMGGKGEKNGNSLCLLHWGHQESFPKSQRQNNKNTTESAIYVTIRDESSQ